LGKLIENSYELFAIALHLTHQSLYFISFFLCFNL